MFPYKRLKLINTLIIFTFAIFTLYCPLLQWMLEISLPASPPAKSSPRRRRRRSRGREVWAWVWNGFWVIFLHLQEALLAFNFSLASITQLTDVTPKLTCHFRIGSSRSFLICPRRGSGLVCHVLHWTWVNNGERVRRWVRFCLWSSESGSAVPPRAVLSVTVELTLL